MLNNKGYFSWDTLVIPLLVTISVTILLAGYFQALTVSGYGDGQDKNVSIGIGTEQITGIQNDINALKNIDVNTETPQSANTSSTQFDTLLFIVSPLLNNPIVKTVTAGLGIAWNVIIMFFTTFIRFNLIIDLVFPTTGALSYLGLVFKFIIIIAQILGVLFILNRLKSAIGWSK
jgi:hypothetical protein